MLTLFGRLKVGPGHAAYLQHDEIEIGWGSGFEFRQLNFCLALEKVLQCLPRSIVFVDVVTQLHGTFLIACYAQFFQVQLTKCQQSDRRRLTWEGDRLVRNERRVDGEVEGATTECVTSLVSDGEAVVTSGGYPTKHISVVKGDGSGELRWKNDTQVYVPSMLVHGGHLYAVTDSGEVLCYDMADGAVKWEHRLGGNFAASPVLVGDQIFATDNKGTTHIFKASPAGFELVGENTVTANEVQATPAICGNQIYMRVAQGEDAQRQEMLYCIGL